MKTRNSHCTPSSFEERTFKRNRIISLIFVGITIVSVAIMFVCSYYMHGRHFFHHHPYDLYADSFMFFKTTLCICALVLLVSLPASWIMLSFMAFRQLPNPRGYKIYNISCHIIAWTSLIVSIVLTILIIEPMGQIFATISFFTFCAFFVTQTIRVMSYSIPHVVQVGSYWVPFVSSDYPIPPHREPIIDDPLTPKTPSSEELSTVVPQGNISEIIEANKDKLAGQTSAQNKEQN